VKLFTSRHPTFYVLNPLLEVSPETGGVAGPVVDVVALGVVQHEVLFVVDLQVSDHGVVFVAPFSIVHVSGRQVSDHIQPVFGVSTSVFAPVERVDICRCPIFFLFPNIDYYTSLSNFVEDVHKGFVGSPTDAHANDDLCRMLSNRSLYHNKNLEYIDNTPNPDHNTVSDTNALPMGATTNHDRKRCLHRYPVQRRHTSLGSRSPLAVREIRWAAAGEY
jgi:hypothetical protein